MTYPVRVSEEQYYGYGDDHTVTLPTGASGQTILLFIGSNGNPTMSTAPSGFTLVDSWTSMDGGSVVRAKVFLYYRVTDGSEGSTVSFTLDADHDVRCRLLRFRNLRAGTVADWLDVNPANSYDGYPYLDWHYPSNFADEEYFCHLGYAFWTGEGIVSSYPTYLEDYRDYDKSTGTDSDVADTTAARFSIYNEFPYSEWYGDAYPITNNWVALAVSLRGDTLGVVNSDLETIYGVGGWVNNAEWGDSFVWQYPEQPTRTLEATYSVFTFPGTLSTLFEDNFTGAAGSVYGHSPDVGGSYYYWWGGTDPSPPQLDGNGWLTPYAAGSSVLFASNVSITSDYYALEATIKFQGEAGSSGQSAEVQLLTSTGDQIVSARLSRYSTGELLVSFSLSGTDGWATHEEWLGDATLLIGNTYTLRVEAAVNEGLAAFWLNDVLLKVSAVGGVTVGPPTALRIYGYDIGQTGSDYNFIFDRVLLEQDSGLVPVSSDYTSTYGLNGVAVSDFSAQYLVALTRVNSSLAPSYQIRTSLSSSVSAAYQVRSVKPSIVSFGLIADSFYISNGESIEVTLPDHEVGDVILVIPLWNSDGWGVFRGTLEGFAEGDGEGGITLLWRRTDGTEGPTATFSIGAGEYIGAKFYAYVLRNVRQGVTQLSDWFAAGVTYYSASPSDNSESFPVLYSGMPSGWVRGDNYLEISFFYDRNTIFLGSYLHSITVTKWQDEFPLFRNTANYSTTQSLVVAGRNTAKATEAEDVADTLDLLFTGTNEGNTSATPVMGVFLILGLEPVGASYSSTYSISQYVSSDFVSLYNSYPLLYLPFEVHYGKQSSRSFVIDYRIDEKSISGFDVSYALPPTLRVGFEVSFAGAVSSDFVVGATLGSTPSYSFDTGYALVSIVRAGFEVAYSDNVASSFEVSSGLWAVPAYGFSATHALVEQRAVAFDASWVLKSISMSFDVGASLVRRVQKSVDVVSALIAKIVEDVEVGFAINNTDQVRAAFDFGYFYSDNSVVLTQTVPSVLVDGRMLDIVSAEVSTDEGGDFWEASFTIGDLADFSVFSVNKAFSLFFCGEEYRLIVDSRAIDRSNPEQVTATIYGVSPAKVYQAPRAALVSKTWDAPTLASEIATELIPALQWQTIDWVIDAGLFGLEEASPLDGVKTLAEVVGAVFESLPDGTMRVRPKYPVSVPNFGAATASFTITDRVDNFSYSEKYTPNKLENLITITDEQDDMQDRVEFIEDEYDKERGVIRVYPAVWRWTVSIRPTGSIRSYAYDGVVTREEEEEVEFVNGVANTSYPVVDIVSAVWNTTDLGSVGFKFYKQELTCSVASDAYSLLKIKYVTQTHNFSIVGTYDTSVQFVVENV